MSKKFSITIIEAPDQNKRENPNNQFSNSEPMTFAQKVDYIKNINMTNNKQLTAVEWFSVRRDVLEIEVRLGKLSPIEYAEELTKAEHQAKEMEKQQRSIELPSDEEIEKESFNLYANDNTYSLNVRQYKAFKRGAKWMRDKIQEQ